MSDTQDALSPTTLVINYLKGKGLSPNAQNIRAALTENARDPSLIPGLRNSAPGEDSSSASPKASGPGVGQRGSAVAKIEGNKTTSASPQDHPNSSTQIAQPSAGGSGGGLDWDTILGVGATGAAALAGRQAGGGEFVGNVGIPNTGRVMDANDPLLTGPPSPGVERTPTGHEFENGWPPGTASWSDPGSVVANDPMQAALTKATGGGDVVPSAAMPMPDATSGPTITPQNVGSGPTITTPRTQAPMPEPAQTPGLMEDFARFIRGIGARR